jgi:malate synthase
VRVGVQYLEAWLRGNGCVPLYNLMEDAATAEISRAQVWQWLRYGVATDDGVPVTAARFARVVEEEMARIRAEVGDARFEGAASPRPARSSSGSPSPERFEEFLTVPAYTMLDTTAV